MLLSLGIILLCQLIGEAVARGAELPVPGPVIGLAICVCLLLGRDRLTRVPGPLRDGTFERTGAVLVSYLSLLFIPAGVGVIQRLNVLADNAVPIVAALVISTVLGLAVTGLVFTFVARRLQ